MGDVRIMAGDLTGKSPAQTYKDLLQVSNSNSGVDSTLRDVCDGEGTVSALQMSTTKVNANGLTDTGNPVVNSILAGTGVAVDATDPKNPVVSASGGGGGGAWEVEAVVDITSTTAEVNITLNPNKDFHEFEYWLEGNTSNDKTFAVLNNDTTLGNYAFQNNSAHNGAVIINEDTSENGIYLSSQNLLSRQMSGKLVIRNPRVAGSTNMRVIAVEGRNAVTSTAYESMDRTYVYNAVGEITTIKIGYRGYILSGFSNRELTGGKIIYRTET